MRKIDDAEMSEWLDDQPEEEPKSISDLLNTKRETPNPLVATTHGEHGTGNWVTELAFEVALGYYPPADLAAQYNLSMATYDKVTQVPDFKRAVQAYQREIDDEGIAFKLRARRSAALLLDELTTMAFDRNVDAKDRLKAIELMCKYAGFGLESKPGEEGTKIVINTNLALNNGSVEKGVYTLSIPDTAIEHE